ncbi:hypothetical protein [Halomonas citrativorans]|uniref:DUF1983 domain-containing protein n=1 Tax=Halomonas citrativorans TaxID=2742612 RepID=A0ABR9F993_9GAMM|nr:hypothetical protein [Halomonas citrativorans]MBE0403058.1 hypothetical protein [Halomonas citrativorans]
MGKARILEAHGDGRYTIEIIEARERAESARQQAEARIQTLTAELNQLETKIQAAQQAVDQAAVEQNAAIQHWQQEVAEQGGSNVDLDAFARKLLEAAGKRDVLRTEKRSKELRIAADQALVARVDALPPLRQMQAWCADYTENLSGEVATAEVPGEVGSVIIKPGFEGANRWSATVDGAIQPALASTPAGTFWNLAMMPGWQKWRPTYRTATITSIGGDACSVTLDDAASSQQGLNVNAQSSYSSVPILYMDCDGAAFEQGDRVLVAFAGNIEGPTVTGFESEPRVCCQPEVLGTHAHTTEPWDVLGQFSEINIKGGAGAEWRIINEDSREVLHSGGVTIVDGEYRLDSLPDEVGRGLREVVSEFFYSKSNDLLEGDIVGSVSYPTREDFAGGTWVRSFFDVIYANGEISRNAVFETGLIDDAGSPIFTGPTDELYAVTYEDESGWSGVSLKGGSVTYSRIRGQLRLEKGCNSVWPDDV